LQLLLLFLGNLFLALLELLLGYSVWFPIFLWLQRLNECIDCCLFGLSLLACACLTLDLFLQQSQDQVPELACPPLVKLHEQILQLSLVFLF